jgi:hypothetical protein
VTEPLQDGHLRLRPFGGPAGSCLAAGVPVLGGDDHETGPGRGAAESLAEASHRRLGGGAVEGEDAAAHGFGGRRYDNGDVGCHPERFERRRPVRERTSAWTSR